VGDACRIDAPDQNYDAAFDFGILHHVERWRDALSEIHRVLKPGARLYAEEIFAGFTSWSPIERLLAHPKAGQFGHDEFRSALSERGFDVDASRDVWGLGGFFVATRT
jgi:ubiquinone/menaquinone biosynthesis C-methylase UbiE